MREIFDILSIVILGGCIAGLIAFAGIAIRNKYFNR